MSMRGHPHRKVILIGIAAIVILLIILSFTVIGTGTVENGMAAVKPHPTPPAAPPISLTPPPPSDQSSGDNTPSIDGTEGDVEDDDTPAPPDQVAAAPSPQVQAPTVQTTTTAETTTTTTTAADQTVTTVDQPKLPQPSSPPVTTQAEPPKPPPPPCLNHPDWAKPLGGWQQAKDGNCYEIPKLDLQLNVGPTSINAPGGLANLTLTVKNAGKNRATGSEFRMHLDGNLSLAGPLRPSQGDPCGNADAQTFVCAVGTIEPGQSVSVGISLKATGNGSVYAYFEPGGEADTSTPGNDHRTIKVGLTALQTQLSVQQHGLLWGGHYYGSVQDFARVLAHEGISWRGWKASHPALAAGLIAHEHPLRRH